MLSYNSFAGCCGAGILFGFQSDTSFNEPGGKIFIDSQYKIMKDFFREKVESAFGPYLTNIGFIHAVLNKFQMKNEPMLLEFGFKKIDSCINKNSKNEIHHYLRTWNSTMSRKEVPMKEVTRKFG